ncbi:hypothetical protein [Shewanella nanhaiensis]|uniref:DUF2569 domain-containing protein n=1 Tax=Shewanella nanhaiensis TaxID=2864872 RepID=A0ABS7E5W3_9GAMM|nr:hypothetical protein [Shewanella nanhaiensis]MBW8184984.1 hypothetical protein [Shewanella nanhaiensis]
MIRIILILASVSLLAYPLWGVLQPTTYLTELLEEYPLAIEVTSVQIQQASALLWISNGILAAAFLLMAKFIGAPSTYIAAKWGALLLILYPIIKTVIEVSSATVLYSHLEHSPISLEFSSVKLFYILFGLALYGIIKSQQGLTQTAN